MRTAISPIRPGRNVITIALASAFLTLSACGSDNDDPAPAEDVSQLSPVVTDDGSNGGTDTGAGNNGAGDNGGGTGAGDNGGTGNTDNGNDGSAGGNDGGGNDGGDTGGNDTGTGDTGTGDNGSTGDGGNGAPDDGDMMTPSTSLPVSSVTLDCNRNTGNGQSEALSATVSFDPASMQFSVNGEATILTDFAWSSEKAVWVSTADVVAGSDSVYHAGHVSLDGVPSFYLERLTTGGMLVEEVVCSAN